MKTRMLCLIAGCIFLAVATLCNGAPAPKPLPPKERATLKGHKNCIGSLAFSPDGRVLASAGWDKTIKLWDMAKGTEIVTLEGHTNSVRSIAFSPDGKMLASGGMDRSLRMWEVAGRKEIGILTDRLGMTDRIIFSADGKTLFTGFFWDIPTRKMREDINGRFPKDGNPWPCWKYNPDGKLLCVVAYRVSPDLDVWDVATGKALHTLERPEEGQFFGRCSAFSPDCKVFASAAQWLCLWDTQSGKLIGSYKRPGDTTALTFSPDGRLLAAAWQRKPQKSGDYEGAISILDTASGKELATLEGHSRPLMCLAFSPDGQTLASGGGGDRLIKLWDVRGVKAPKKKD